MDSLGKVGTPQNHRKRDIRCDEGQKGPALLPAPDKKGRPFCQRRRLGAWALQSLGAWALGRLGAAGLGRCRAWPLGRRPALAFDAGGAVAV